MKYLADGKTVSFEDIKNDILYAVDQDSTVEDYMGWVKDDYNFDLKSIDRLTVGGRSFLNGKMEIPFILEMKT